MSSIDVIVPCYRYAHFLRECVESVLAQNADNIRVLIIDDASPDNTAEVAAQLMGEDSRVNFIRHTNNKGHIATYNEGIDWASGEYLLLLSADDYLLPGALNRATCLLDEHTEVGFVFGNVVTLLADQTEVRSDTIFTAFDPRGWRILTGSEFILLSGCFNRVPTPTAVVRTKLQKRLGGYRPELPHSGDMEMWLRFAANGNVGVLMAYQAVYRRHCDNMSLGYMAQKSLLDIQQRKLALDYFFECCGHLLPASRYLRSKLCRSLGFSAFNLASSAFNDSELIISRQLSDFALQVCPNIWLSAEWMKLTFKRQIGPKAWHALWPLISLIRHSGRP